MSTTVSAPSLPARFAAAIGLLVRGLAVSLPQNWGNAPLALLAWTRLKRLLARFTALVAAVEAGRISVSARSKPGISRPRPPAPAVRLPCGSGWLLRLAPVLDTRIGRTHLEGLLGDPELAALLAQAPQAGRILRPLCHMLGIETPAALRLPPRSRRRPDPSGGTDSGANGGKSPPARAARPSPRASLIPPAWLIPPASPPSPATTPACAPADPIPPASDPPHSRLRCPDAESL